MPKRDETVVAATRQRRLVGGSVGVLSAEALIQYASHLQPPYDRYIVLASPVIAASFTALLPKVLATIGILLSSAAEYVSEKLDVWKGNRTIRNAKRILRGKDISEEQRTYLEDAIRSHKQVIIEAQVPMPKTKAKEHA